MLIEIFSIRYKTIICGILKKTSPLTSKGGEFVEIRFWIIHCQK